MTQNTHTQTQTPTLTLNYLPKERTYFLAIRKSLLKVVLHLNFFQVFLKPCSHVVSCQQVEVEPVSADDWEILVKKTK